MNVKEFLDHMKSKGVSLKHLFYLYNEESDFEISYSTFHKYSKGTTEPRKLFVDRFKTIMTKHKYTEL